MKIFANFPNTQWSQVSLLKSYLVLGDLHDLHAVVGHLLFVPHVVAEDYHVRRLVLPHAAVVLGVEQQPVLELLQDAVVHVVGGVAGQVHQHDALPRVPVDDVGGLAPGAVEGASVGDKVLAQRRLAFSALLADDPQDLAEVHGPVHVVVDGALPGTQHRQLEAEPLLLRQGDVLLDELAVLGVGAGAEGLDQLHRVLHAVLDGLADALQVGALPLLVGDVAEAPVDVALGVVGVVLGAVVHGLLERAYEEDESRDKFRSWSTYFRVSVNA